MYKVLGSDQRQYGPIDAEQVRQWIRERRLNQQSLAQREDSDIWMPLGAFAEFQEELARAGTAPPPPPAAFPLPEAEYGMAPRTNPLAIAGLILGIFAIFPGICCCGGFPFNILGLIFSAVAMSQIQSHPQREGGKALALTGIILNVVSLLLGLMGGLVGPFFNLGHTLGPMLP